MPLFEVEFYERASGKQPAKEFLLSLDKKMRAKMLSMIAILAENGTELREPYSKYISDGILNCGQKSVPILQGFYIFSGQADTSFLQMDLSRRHRGYLLKNLRELYDIGLII